MSVDKVVQHTKGLERTLKSKKEEEYQLRGMLKEIKSIAKECNNEYKDVEGMCIDHKIELTKEVSASLSVIESYQNLLNNLENDNKNANEIMQTVLAKKKSLIGNKLTAKIIVCQYMDSVKTHHPVYQDPQFEENIRQMREDRQRKFLEAHKLIRNSVHYC